MNIAFKEWAVICRLLAQGRQSVILRKGGIAEVGGEFQPEHMQFWLYPTYFHERQRDGIRPEFAAELDAADAERPTEGMVRLSHWVEVTRIDHATTLEQALSYTSLHGWTDTTVKQRFEYRTPGLFVLHVEVHAADAPRVIRETPEYAGCKSWVHLADSDCLISKELLTLKYSTLPPQRSEPRFRPAT